MTKGIFLFVVFVVLGEYISFAQTDLSSCFFSDDNSEVYVNNDTVVFVLRNDDAFNTYSVGKCLINSNNEIEYISIGDAMSEMIISDIASDSSFIEINLYSGQPFPYAMVFIKNLCGDILYSASCDINGKLSIPKRIIQEFYGESVIIQSYTLGIIVEQLAVLQDSRKYLIKSLIPESDLAFIPCNENIDRYFIYYSNDSIRITEQNKTRIFVRDSLNKSMFSFIFNIP